MEWQEGGLEQGFVEGCEVPGEEGGVGLGRVEDLERLG